MVTMGNEIASLRKQKGMTQESLANELGVSNQAVSKWEADQCCPDIQLLPKLADIFEVSIDCLFGRAESREAQIVENKVICNELPWADDDTLRVVAYIGHTLQEFQSLEGAEDIHVIYDGDVADVKSCISVQCRNVDGDIDAGGNVFCGNVDGDINNGGHVHCGNVDGDVANGGHVECGKIVGDVSAGGTVKCGDVVGDVNAGGSVQCGDVEGDVDAGGYVECGNVGGDVDCGTHVNCEVVEGDVDAGGNVTCKEIHGDVN